MPTAKKLYNASLDAELLYLEDVYITGKIDIICFYIHIKFMKKNPIIPPIIRCLCCKSQCNTYQSSLIWVSYMGQRAVWSSWNDYYAWNQVKRNENRI